MSEISGHAGAVQSLVDPETETSEVGCRLRWRQSLMTRPERRGCKRPKRPPRETALAAPPSTGIDGGATSTRRLWSPLCSHARVCGWRGVRFVRPSSALRALLRALFSDTVGGHRRAYSGAIPRVVADDSGHGAPTWCDSRTDFREAPRALWLRSVAVSVAALRTEAVTSQGSYRSGVSSPTHATRIISLRTQRSPRRRIVDTSHVRVVSQRHAALPSEARPIGTRRGGRQWSAGG